MFVLEIYREVKVWNFQYTSIEPCNDIFPEERRFHTLSKSKAIRSPVSGTPIFYAPENIWIIGRIESSSMFLKIAPRSTKMSRNVAKLLSIPGRVWLGEHSDSLRLTNWHKKNFLSISVSALPEVVRISSHTNSAFACTAESVHI